MTQEKIVMYDSPEAATYKTGIEGWVSRDGFFWGKDEHMARYSGSTHKKCKECGTVYSKQSYCDFCQAKKETEKYYAMPMIEWDETSPVCEWHNDKYFWDKEEVLEYMYEMMEDAKSLGCEAEVQLVLCEPHYLHLLSGEEWSDDIAEDNEGELPDEVEAAIDVLNAVIKSQGPTCWYPGKQRINMEPLWAELKAESVELSCILETSTTS